MPSKSRNYSDRERSSIYPEFSTATPWVVDMDDDQRKAHARQMDAHAQKIEAEAKQIRSNNALFRLRIGALYAALSLALLLVGFGLGFIVAS